MILNYLNRLFGTNNLSKHSKQKKILLENFLSLSTLQALNMLLPLLTFPYLVRVLGVENFGLVNFSLALISYFNIVVSFGFDLSATKEVSLYRSDSKKLSEIFSAVTCIKAIMVSISLIVLLLMIIFIDSINKNSILYVYTFGIVIGNILFPSWFFQGVEKMKYITIITTVTRVIFTILIFILVKDESHYLYVPLLNSLGVIFGGIIALKIIFNNYSIEFYFPKKLTLFSYLNESFYYFISRVSNSGSRYFAVTIIGIHFGNVVVGYYSIVEKLFYFFTSIGGLVAQTIYPYMVKTKNLLLLKRIFIYTVAGSIPPLLILMFFNEIFIFWLFDIKNEMVSKMFLIVFSGSIFSIASSIIGYPLLAAFGHANHANNSLIYSSIIYLIYILYISLTFDNIFLVSLSIVIYVLSGLIFRIYYIKKEKIFQKNSVNK